MKYLGIDTSTIALPYSVFDDKYLEQYGLIKLKGDYIEDKLKQGFEELQTLIEKYDIDVVVLEDVFMGRNFKSAKSAVQMIGVLKLAAYLKGATSFTVLATKWRKGIIKSGQKTSVKEQAVDYVNDMYDLDLVYRKSRTKTDDDIAEAILMVEGLVYRRYLMGKVRVFDDKVRVVQDGEES